MFGNDLAARKSAQRCALKGDKIPRIRRFLKPWQNCCAG